MFSFKIMELCHSNALGICKPGTYCSIDENYTWMTNHTKQPKKYVSPLVFVIFSNIGFFHQSSFTTAGIQQDLKNIRRPVVAFLLYNQLTAVGGLRI